MVRTARFYILVHPSDCFPPHKLDMTPGSRDDVKVKWLRSMFEKNGFDPNFPALKGYPLNGKIQLLSGTHRHEAANQIDMSIPVEVYPRAYVEAYWGTERWSEIMKDMSVKDLEKREVPEISTYPSVNERVDLFFDYDRQSD